MAKGRRHKMSKPKEGRGDGQAEAAAAESNEKRPAGRPRMNGENIFSCQSKIHTFMSPNKSPTIRPPLQEENSTTHHEAKCPGKTVNENYGKGEDRISIGNAVEGAVKSEVQNDKESGGESPGSFSNQKPEATETPKHLPAESTVAANAKPTQKKGTKTKSGPKRKVQGKTQPNRKVTDYYPVRRSSRKSKKELQIEEKKRIDELIESGKEEGMKIDFIDGKGRGVIATRHFNRGEFVVEYHGDLIEITDAKKREALYAQDPSTGCYMYYFQYLSKTYCVDATKETSRLGRLINHSKCGNCQTKLHDIDGVPHLILVALRDIEAGEELLYDYGDRSRASIEAHPWLKH
ncbi:N-lysine methyltransferase KMT5A isoform X2 [Eublepharis macularius]|uniref:[histone H4]-lysine(20) N-methyltransferase n=1 Tax=Eublepharis macularius TaxID=481883 RepID=A0AA97LEC5_EUBMA|nr:N-lysine methyltransferase KMT5A isoform X2 [Eublepharis macularius]